jgi:hypothetical protein
VKPIALSFVLVAAISTGCADRGVHRAEVLDVPLEVRVSSFRVSPHNEHLVRPKHDRTYVLIDVHIMNPSDRELWANDCHARAVDRNGQLLFEFGFTPAIPAGAYLRPHARFSGRDVEALAPTTEVIAAHTAQVTAECAAWDWGDSPPI